MRRRLRACGLLLVVAVVFCCADGGKRVAPESIILFIGDGMGISHVTAAKITKGVLSLEAFETVGLLTTRAADKLITDSAAASTALATGHKTYSGAISVSTERETLRTALEYAEREGKSTGLVVTCSVTHATPAAFAAHVDSRAKQDVIAEQMTQSGIDVLFGGGWGYFIPDTCQASKRKDSRDLMAQLERQMMVIRSAEGFRGLGSVPRVAGLFSPGHLPRASQRSIGLAELTRKAIEILSANPRGFFLMVEGSQIDWAGHQNDTEYIIEEMLDFDEAVGVGLEFAQRDGHTLVIVTADHETGGFAVHGGSVQGRKVTDTGFTSKGHTAGMVPVFAYGPGSEAFGGIQDNTIVGIKTIEYVCR